MEAAIESAALRGVDVRLLLPRRSDHPLVRLASRSYYASLLSAGVRIFEYNRGFVHAKTLVVDDWVGSIGSANMDVRSFELNYELNAFCYGSRFTDDLGEQFTADLRDARPVTLEEVLDASYPTRLGQGFARLLSPLL